MFGNIRKILNERGISDAAINCMLRFLTWMFLVASTMFIFNGRFNGRFYTGGFFKAFDYIPDAQIWLFLISINVLLWMIYSKICQLTKSLAASQNKNQLQEQQ